MGEGIEIEGEEEFEMLPLAMWSLQIASKSWIKHCEKLKKQCLVPERWQYYAELSATKIQTTGDSKLKALMHALERLDALGFKRSKSQKLFHKAYIGACLKKIYGPDLYKNLGRLLREYDLDELRSDVILCTPRRHGKTMSVALFVAAYMFTQPNCEISIYSTGRRASRKILAQIWKMVVTLAGTQEIVKVYNQEALEIIGTGQFTSKCFSYPSKVQIDNIYTEENRQQSTPSYIFNILSENLIPIIRHMPLPLTPITISNHKEYQIFQSMKKCILFNQYFNNTTNRVDGNDTSSFKIVFINNRLHKISNNNVTYSIIVTYYLVHNSACFRCCLIGGINLN